MANKKTSTTKQVDTNVSASETKSSQELPQETTTSVPKKTSEKKVKKEKTVEKSAEKSAEKPLEKKVKKEKVVKDDVPALTDDSGEVLKKIRVTPTRESVSEGFDELISLVDSQIESLRENQTKSNGIKFLRSLNKRLKTLKNQASRIKQRNTSVKKSNPNSNSGFLKPVKISADMAKFTGWSTSEPKSRVDVTKYLCNYIKEHNLQNPEDKRQIIPDAKLAKLIKFDSKKETEPLRYYSLQKYLKPHFIKDTSISAEM